MMSCLQSTLVQQVDHWLLFNNAKQYLIVYLTPYHMAYLLVRWLVDDLFLTFYIHAYNKTRSKPHYLLAFIAVRNAVFVISLKTIDLLSYNT